MSSTQDWELLVGCLCDRMYLQQQSFERSFAALGAKLDALDAKVEAMDAKIEALGPQKEAPVCEKVPEAPDLGAFGQLSVEEQHRMQQRGGDY